MTDDLISRAAAISEVQRIAIACGVTGEPFATYAAKEAIRALPAAQVQVKPLVWQWDRTAFSADGAGVCYRVAKVHGQWMWFETGHKWNEEQITRKGRSSSEKSAKAKAQKLHDARIRAALVASDPTPASHQPPLPSEDAQGGEV